MKLVVAEELALIIVARKFHAVHLYAAVSADADRYGDFVFKVKAFSHFFLERFAAILGVGYKCIACRIPLEIALIARPAFFVALLFRRWYGCHHGLHSALHLFVSQVAVEEDAGVVDEHALEIRIFKELLEHAAWRPAVNGAAAAKAAETAPHATVSALIA